MSIDALALLPLAPADVQGRTLEEPWEESGGPGGGAPKAWRRLRDASLVNLGVPVEAPDAQIYDVAKGWSLDPGARIWVFPDTAIPEANTARAIRDATRQVGRWVSAPRVREPSPLEAFGFSAEQAARWQGEVNSGDVTRVKAAFAELEKRIEGRDPGEVAAIQEAFLKKLSRR